MEDNYFIILWWFLPYIDMNQPRVYMCPPSWTRSHLPPHPISLGCPRALALSALLHASNLHWWSILHMVTIYMFQCYSLNSSHPCLLPGSPKVCSSHLCLFCYLIYRIIVTVWRSCHIFFQTLPVLIVPTGDARGWSTAFFSCSQGICGICHCHCPKHQGLGW